MCVLLALVALATGDALVRFVIPSSLRSVCCLSLCDEQPHEDASSTHNFDGSENVFNEKNARRITEQNELFTRKNPRDIQRGIFRGISDFYLFLWIFLIDDCILICRRDSELASNGARPSDGRGVRHRNLSRVSKILTGHHTSLTRWTTGSSSSSCSRQRD